MSGPEYSGGLKDFTCLQTASADANPFGNAVNETSNRLQVRFKASASAIVGMRDAITELRPFAADFANFSHCVSPVVAPDTSISQLCHEYETLIYSRPGQRRQTAFPGPPVHHIEEPT